MQYDIVTAGTAAGLTAKVNMYINEGWQPLGGVSVALDGSPVHGWLVFAQAMVKVVVG